MRLVCDHTAACYASSSVADLPPSMRPLSSDDSVVVVRTSDVESMVQARQNLRLLGDADWHHAALGVEIANEGADRLQSFLRHAIARGS